MRVFVTGATGFIGSAIVDMLVKSGHQVVGLARSEAAAARLTDARLEAHYGALSDLDSLVAEARNADGVIHTAFDHDFSKYAEAMETDRLCVQALCGALEGTGKPMVIASGTLMVAHESPCTEADVPASPDVPRARAEAIMLDAADRGVRTITVRLPPSVHDLTRGGFAMALVAFARKAGFSAYVGDGMNRWPAVHRLDAARLFALALERGEAGTHLHAAAEEGITLKTIAETIGEGLKMPVRSLSPDEAVPHFDWLSRFIALDNVTSSSVTRADLGWDPSGPTLIEDLQASHCYANSTF